MNISFWNGPFSKDIMSLWCHYVISLLFYITFWQSSPICNFCWCFEATSMENGAANMLKASCLCGGRWRSWDLWIEDWHIEVLAQAVLMHMLLVEVGILRFLWWEVVVMIGVGCWDSVRISKYYGKGHKMYEYDSEWVNTSSWNSQMILVMLQYAGLPFPKSRSNLWTELCIPVGRPRLELMAPWPWSFPACGPVARVPLQRRPTES